MKKTKTRAFTMVELVIVIAVLGVLAAVLIPVITGVISRANESSDRSLARNLSTTLRVSERNISDLKSIKETIDESYGEDFSKNLVPKTVQKGNHFWYNASTKMVELKTLEEVQASETFTKFDSSFRSSIKSGYVLLDTDGSDIALTASLIETVYSRMECDKILEYFAESSDIANNFVSGLDNTLIINENGCLRGSNVNAIENVYFTSDNVDLDKTTYFEVSNDKIDFKNISLDTPLAGLGLHNKTINIKKTMHFGTGTLIFADDAKVTLKVDVDELSDLRSIFGAESTNARIQINNVNNDENVYKLVGADLVDVETGEVISNLFSYTIPQKVLNYQMKQIDSVSVSQDVVATNNYVSQDVNIDSETVSAVIPAGVKVDSETLELSVAPKEASEANLKLGNYATTSIDVHIEGVSKDNDVPIIVNLGQIMNPNLSATQVKMYHVEDYDTIEMTLVSSLEELGEHNTFYYNKEDGNVTIAVKSFSEYTIAERTSKRWDGTYDYKWYTDNTSAPTFYIDSAEELAGLASIVNGTFATDKADSGVTARFDFKDRTIELEDDIVINDWFLTNAEVEAGLKRETTETEKGYIGSGTHSAIGMSTSSTNDAAFLGSSAGIIKAFPVIGKDTTNTFRGSFDGQNHYVSGLFGLHYDDPAPAQQKLGLFGVVDGGTGASRINFSNLTIKDSWYYFYHGNIGLVANQSKGNVTYEHINIIENYTSQYNWYSGGVVGYIYPTSNTVFDHIVIDDTNIFEALWETYDAGVGGLVGEMGISKDNKPIVTITNCDIYPVMNVYNDCCANYQWFAYRYSGMVIGYLYLINGCDIDRHQYLANEEYLTMWNVKVHYGNWHNYYYYKSPANGQPSYAGVHDWKYRRYKADDLIFDGDKVTVKSTKLTEINGIIEKQVIGKDGKTYDITKDDVETFVELPFDQLFGGGQGFYGVTTSKLNDLRSVADSGVNQDTSIVKVIKDGVVQKKELAINGSTYSLDSLTQTANNVYRWSDGTNLYTNSFTVARDTTINNVQRIILDPGCWNKDGARYAVRGYNSAGKDKWFDMSLDGYRNVYTAYVPVTYLAKVDFCRMDGSTTENTEANRWNYSGDITGFDTHVGYTFNIGSNFNNSENAWHRRIYLEAKDWNQTNARYAVYFFNNSTNTWRDMVKVAITDSIYSCTIPDGYSDFIFGRMNGSNGTNSFDYDNDICWNQTGNISLGNHLDGVYRVYFGDNGSSPGEWLIW